MVSDYRQEKDIPIQEHGVPADIIKATDFRQLTTTLVDDHAKAWANHMARYNAWQNLARVVNAMEENPFGKTGLTAGKFLNLWVENCGRREDHIHRSIKALKNTLEMMARVDKHTRLKTIKSVYQLRENDKGKGKGKGKKAAPSSVRFTRADKENIAKALRGAGLSEAKVAHLLMFGVHQK